MNVEDSLEKIKEDAIKLTNKYWNCEYVCNYCPSRIDELKPYKYYGTMDCTEAMKIELIDRTVKVMKSSIERTCRIESSTYDELLDCFTTKLSCGCLITSGWSFFGKYCPNCGAKVVE